MVGYPSALWQGKAEITCVAAIKNKPWRLVRRWYESLCRQTEPVKIIVVDYGSAFRYLSWERRLFLHGDSPASSQEWTTLIEVRRNTERWREGHALNIGIRQCETEFLFTTNADLIYDPIFVQTALAALRADPNRLIICDRIDLSPDGSPIGVVPSWYYGTCIGARRSWFEKVHGFDERYIGWGRVDMDIVDRARDDGLSIYNIGQDTKVMHQFHPHVVETCPWMKDTMAHNDVIYRAREGIVRNQSGWGEK